MSILTRSEIEDTVWKTLMGRIPAVTKAEEAELVAGLAVAVAEAITKKQQEVR